MLKNLKKQKLFFKICVIFATNNYIKKAVYFNDFVEDSPKTGS